MNVALAVSLALLAVTLVVIVRSASRSRTEELGAIRDALAHASGPRTALERDPDWLAEVRAEIAELTFKSERMLREARSRESSATHAVRRARTELADRGAPADERLEAVADDLGIFDDEGSEGSGVLPLRANVASASRQAQGGTPAGDQPSWETVARKTKFGF